MVPWTRPTLRFARSAFPRERVRSMARFCGRRCAAITSAFGGRPEVRGRGTGGYDCFAALHTSEDKASSGPHGAGAMISL
jgi:hypothetical protein